MTDTGAGQEGMEEFAARLAEAEARLTEFTAQAEEYRQALEERDRTIASQGAEIVNLRQERLQERFTREAEAFSAIGAETEALAGHLVWLFQVDESEGRQHYHYITELLTTVNRSLETGDAFREIGTSRQPAGGSVISRVEAKVKALAESRGLKIVQGSEEWGSLLSEVFKAEPHLYSEYRQSMM